ncbi:hypothetical protein [Streptosporangium saharense]|uniref:Uncharacterized protein n=1 Tax=Streptosporangium saharense TaxID=1706840 RepID=A0A7W7QUI7_9ACTN|nr:hypothetical protein [Streptosporangium saharense]MBB4920028.1 hypothetical protein [Streptosporangium saharense]
MLKPPCRKITSTARLYGTRNSGIRFLGVLAERAEHSLALDVEFRVAQHDLRSATFFNPRWRRQIMHLRFLGKATSGGQSPTLYATGEDSYVVQGWIVTDEAILAKLDLDDNETVVEIYARLLSFLENDGLSGTVGNIVPPIVHVMENGNYVVKGARVEDPAILEQMDIPNYETCVLVEKRVMALLG